MKVWLAIFGVFVSGCATQKASLKQHLPPTISQIFELEKTPFFPETAHQCGPAALATALNAAGFSTEPALLSANVFIPKRQGSLQTEMLASSPTQGAVATRVPPTLVALVQEVAANHPVLVLQNLGLQWAPQWHYAVVVGYHLPNQTVMLRSGNIKRQVLSMRTFEHTWERSGYWAFVVTPPGQWPTTAQETAVVEAAVGFERSALPSQAKQVYASALQRWPHNLTLAMGLGNSHFALGDKPQAAEIFEATAKQHQSAPAWINLTLTLLELGRQAEALKAAQTAVALADPYWQAQAQDALQRAQNLK
jgi:hypothetical protein